MGGSVVVVASVVVAGVVEETVVAVEVVVVNGKVAALSVTLESLIGSQPVSRSVINANAANIFLTNINITENGRQ
jgi:fructose-specific phosphotransferase system IIC component